MRNFVMRVRNERMEEATGLRGRSWLHENHLPSLFCALSVAHDFFLLRQTYKVNLVVMF